MNLLKFVAVLLLTRQTTNTTTNGVDSLELQVEKLFGELDSLPLSISCQKGNIEVRTRFSGDCMVSVAEAKRVDCHPREFRHFLENFSEAFPQVNPLAKNVIPLEGDANRQAVKSVLNFPFPLSNRIMVHWKYLLLDRSPDEHMLIVSEEGNEDILAKYLNADEKDKYVLARTFLCVYWIKPIREAERIVGSTVRYAFSGDTGGSIPAFIQNTIGPKSALDSVQGLISYVKKRSLVAE